MQLRSDTIVAPGTVPGRSAIAVLRLSGADAHVLGRRVCARWPVEARSAVRTLVMDPETERPIDDAIVTRFDAPSSYTGEPIVEFSCHGGLSVVRDLMAVMVHLGARPADPGEFTQRAVLNGKMDLLQAEAIADLVDATTTTHRQIALAQLHGGLSALVQELREAMLDIEALLAYDVDFPEEDDGPVARVRIADAARHAADRITALVATVPLGEVARDGALVVLAGEPNTGKSSLFNALLGTERAIVTEIAGTTRDAIEARVDRPAWPIRLVDTAGLRETEDQLERLGIEVSERHIANAHLVLVCGETAEELDRALAHVRARTSAPAIRVATKADRHDTKPLDGADVHVSATTCTGLDRLLLLMDQQLGNTLGSVPIDGVLVTRARQQAGLEAARRELAEFVQVWEAADLPATIAAVHIRTAVTCLDALIGSVDIEDVLERVFRTFCVGK